MAVEISARARTLTLVAMTLANSMILIDQTAVPLAIPRITHELGGSVATGQWVLIANVLPLGALMVFGGRLGDLFGLRRVFLLGAVTFITSSALVGVAQDIWWLLAMRVTQGMGAALMMPTTMAIIGAVFPAKDRGRALGLMAGASAFFAAMGPLVGGLLTEYLGWRAVFLVNVPLAAITVILTLASTPDVRPDRTGGTAIDTPGLVAFALGICGLTVAFGQAQTWGWLSVATISVLGVGVVGLAAFVMVDRRRPEPLIDLGLFRHRSFTAANVSQVAAGAIALVTGYLLPFYLLLVVGISPGAAGIALLPSTIPVILAAPLAGRWFDKAGGRLPLMAGYAVLAAASLALVAGVSERSVLGIVPGLVLLGIGLGIVQTVNDPVGLDEVPLEKQGQASGVIDTSEQVGGVMGLALYLSVFMGFLIQRLVDMLANRGIRVTPDEMEAGREFAMRAEQHGLRHVDPPPVMRAVLQQYQDAHVDAYRLAFFLIAVLAVGAGIVCFGLLRRVPAGSVSEEAQTAG